MSIAEHMPLGEVKNRLSEVVDEVERQHARVVITKHGRPAAIVLSIDDLESLEETLSVMSSPGLAGEIREALSERDAGEGRVFSKEEALHLAAEPE